MSQQGGSATVYGVLYQLLGSLHHLAVARVIHGQDGLQVRVEPNDGGDVQLGGGLIVEQWKSRSDGATWSFRELVREVLPDLYRAVRMPLPNVGGGMIEYRFVTEGRRGNWGDADRLFNRCHGDPTRADPTGDLDDALDVRVAGIKADEARTERGLFEWVVFQLQSLCREAREDSPPVIRVKTRFLLGHFRMIEGRTSDALSADISAALELIIDYREDIAPCLARLRDAVGEACGRGNEEIRPREFFLVNGLRADSLDRLGDLREKLKRRNAAFAAHMGFRHECDARVLPEDDGAPRLLIVHGSVGTGRTWHVCALADRLSDDGHLCVLVRGSASAELDCEAAARVVWQDLLGHDRPLGLRQLASRLGPILAANSDASLVVVIDDVRDPAQLQRLADLVHELPERPRLRLVVTTTTSVAKHFDDGLAPATSDVSFRCMEEFSDEDVRRALGLRGRAWDALPADTRRSLRLPLLAGLYCLVSEGDEWRPRNEYELYQRFWDLAGGPSERAPFLRQRLVRLAEQLLSPETSYPWSFFDAEGVGVDVETVLDLQRVGWLRQAAGDDFEIFQERLLDWCVAQAIALRWRRAISRANAESLLTRLARGESLHPARPLGYVLCDTLWVLSEPDRCDVTQFADLLAKLERASNADAFYRLFSTLGARAVPALVQRLRDADAAGEDAAACSITDALERTACAEPDAVAKGIRDLLENPSDGHQQRAFGLLVRVPNGEALEALWNRFRSRPPHAEKDAAGAQPGDDLEVYARRALHACVGSRPDWLERELREETEPRALADLVGLLDGVDACRASQIWERSKARLWELVSAKDRDRLAHCVGRFRDGAELARLYEYLADAERWTREEAFVALARLAPDRAMTWLRAHSWRDVEYSWNLWVLQLLLSTPAEFEDWLVEQLGSGALPAFQGAALLSDATNLLSPRTIHAFVGAFALSADGEPGPRGASPMPRGLLPFVLGVTSPGGIGALRAAAPSALVVRVEAAVEGIVQAGFRRGAVAWGADDAVHALLALGGDVRSLLARALQSPSAAARAWSAEWAQFVDPTPAILDGCREVAEGLWSAPAMPILAAAEPAPRTASGTDPLVILAARRSIAALLLAGCHEDVLRLLVQHGAGASAPLLPVLADRDVDSSLFEPSIAAARGTDPARRRHGVLALSLSRDASHAAHVHAALSAAPEDDALRQAAVFALAQLGDTSVATVNFLASLLGQGKLHDSAAHALLRTGSPASLEKIESHLLAKPTALWRHVDVDLALRVLANSASPKSPLIAQAVRLLLKRPGMTIAPMKALVALGEGAPDEDLWRTAFNAAFDEQGGLVVVGERAAAIRLLADPELEWRATTRALERDRDDKQQCIALLLERDEPRAIAWLCKYAGRQSNAVVRASVARALRTAGSRDSVQRGVCSLLADPDPRYRSAGGMLAEFQPETWAETHLRDAHRAEGEPDVRTELERSICRWHDHSRVRGLMDVLGEIASEQLPLYLAAALRTGDIFGLLGHRGPNSYGSKVQELPMRARYFISESYEQAKKDSDARIARRHAR